MKYLFLFLVSFYASAETYKVSHKGHVYAYEETNKVSSFRGEKFRFEIPVLPCSETTTNMISEHFKAQLRKQTTSVENIVEVKTPHKTLLVSEGVEGGRNLIAFADYFAKQFLVYKELCKSTKK